MLNPLVESAGSVEVQNTTFSIDVLGRYICNTWQEATASGSRPFDAVVIGAGMFGAYCAEKLYRTGYMRVLVLEAGSFLVSEHVQNLSRIGLETAPAVKVPSNAQDPGTRQRVWGIPWRSQTGFPGLAYCVGGKSLYWGGWSPELTPADLAQWPAKVKDYLTKGPKAAYKTVGREIGSTETTDYISGNLYQALKNKCTTVISAGIPTLNEAQEAPLAIQGKAPASGLFSFDKYSSAPILIEAIREAASLPDADRKLFLVPKAHVVKLHTTGNSVSRIEVRVNGQQQFLSISPACAVVLASSTIESTRLALESFPTNLMGRNLMGHLRSNLVIRIHRSVFAGLPAKLEAAALLVRGSTPQGRFHLQITAAAVMGANSEATMFRMIPNIDLLDKMLASQDAQWIVLTLRGIGEMQGDKNASPSNPSTSWMDLSSFERDQFGLRRAWVNLVTTPNDEQLWNQMDAASLALAQAIAGDPSKIQYFYNQNGSLNEPGADWHNNPAPASLSHDRNNPNNKVRDGLGTTHHEAGTLWMGEIPATSVTDLNGRFHPISNAYAAGAALFPTIGSANPTVTGLALARKTAAAIARELAPVVEPDFNSLFNGQLLPDWVMAGAGKFQVFSNVIETEGGTGLLWYKKKPFKDFILRVDWRVMDRMDNSGVYVRFPLLNTDPETWLQKANSGWEVQIDERGFDSATSTEGDPLKVTGAVYDKAPAQVLSAARPVREWNTFEIKAEGSDISVLLNGIPVSQLTDPSRPDTGFIGLQNHHPGSRVQFGNIRIKELN